LNHSTDNEMPEETNQSAAIQTMHRELDRLRDECVTLRAERDEALRMRAWDNRAISIARHYGYQPEKEAEFEDGRIRPARVLEKVVEVAIDAWVDGNAVTIQLCPSEVGQWVALVVVAGQDATAFAMDEELSDVESDPHEIWMSRAVLTALDHARRGPVPEEEPEGD
jgi:hypothetical protein